jgi:hypothetical protein
MDDSSILATALVNNPPTVLPLILAVSAVLFRSIYVFHELGEAKFFAFQSPLSLMHACVAGSRPTRLNTLSFGWICRLITAGLVPIWLLGLFPPFGISLLIAVAGLAMASPLAKYWTIMESVKSQTMSASQMILKFGVLIFPFISLMILGTLQMVVHAYDRFVMSVTVSSGLAGLMPSRALIIHWSDILTELLLTIYLVTSLVTIGYKRLIGVMLKFV